MIDQSRFIAKLFGISLAISACIIGCFALDEVACQTNGTSTCDTEDLSHSVLIECSSTSCATAGSFEPLGNDYSMNDWPSHRGEITHIHSSRAGSRFTKTRLANLDYQEDDHTRMLDINTTFYIYTPAGGDALLGFGATIEFWSLDRALRDNQFGRLFKPLFTDLFGGAKQGGHFDFLRLRIDMSGSRTLHLRSNLSRLDDQLGNQVVGPDSKLRILIDLQGANYEESKIEMGPNLTFANIIIWAIADDSGSHSSAFREAIPDIMTFRSGKPLELADIDLDWSLSLKSSGLLIRSDPSIPYNYLEQMRQKVDLPVMTLGKSLPKTRSPGDWQNAQESAVELINHLKYGSRGYIEYSSIDDMLQNPSATCDASLYSLHADHGIHFRGPNYYTIGHFSRYVKEGSFILTKTELFTQPNMFAAHYSAFLSSDKKFIVAVVVNENEHLLPFRLAIDRRIKTVTNLEAQSINTFLINMS